MFNKIIQNEWLQWQRDSRLKGLSVFFFAISLIALWHQLDFQGNLSKIRNDAQRDSRQEWLAQEAKHPHMAAHFGNYAYKKPSMLHCFDPGLSIYTGTSVYMEPHRQNDFLFSKSQESDTGLRFGWLSPALICQLIFPLLIILLTFNAINGERERGTLPLLLAQGASFRDIIFAKTVAAFTIFEGFFTAYLLATIVASGFLLGAKMDISSIFYVWAVYSLYFFGWSLLGVFVSAKVKNAGASIAILLLLWMFTNIIIPRISANIAENIYPLTTNYAFKKQVAESVQKGLDGHNPSSERAKKLEKELLTQYKVDSVQQLPFNFEGLVMQQSEEYSSKVYDVHFSKIFETLKKQKNIQAWFAAFSPFIAVRNLSMVGCNANLETDIDFQQQAENFRRSFVQDMNNDMKDNSAFGSFETYRVKTSKYAAINDLQVENRPLSWSLPSVATEHIWLLLWGLGLVFLAFKISENKLIYD